MNSNILIIAFCIYSFLGWCTEVAYQYWTHKKFINRGFLKGPFCPIYAVCILTLILSLEKFNDNIILLFIIATVLTSVIEYVTSYILEKIFSLKWWDYTDDPFNLHGRICFHFSLGWGLASVFVIKIVNPIIINSINLLSEHALYLLSIVIVTYFILDLFITLIGLLNNRSFSLLKLFNNEKFRNLYNK